MKTTLLKLTAFALLVFVFPNHIFSQSRNSVKNINNKMNVISFNKYLPNATVNNGYYFFEKNEDEICMEMTDNLKINRQQYMIVNCFEIDDFVSNENNSIITIHRKSGSMELTSSTENTGKFKFTKNPDFVNFLEDEGVALDNDLYYFKLFLGDIEKNYLLEIKKLGYNPTMTELGRLVWHDTSISFIEKVKNLLPELSLNEVSMLSAHNISVSYLKGLKDLGINTIRASEIKKAKLKGVTLQMIKLEIDKGNKFDNLEAYLSLFKSKKKY